MAHPAFPPDPPAWWETPQRTALRAAAWITCAAWVVAAVWRTLRQTERTVGAFTTQCTPDLAGQAPQLLVMAAGVALTVWGLNVPPMTVRGRVLVVAGLLVLWGFAAFAYGPAGDVDCALN